MKLGVCQQMELWVDSLWEGVGEGRLEGEVSVVGEGVSDGEVYGVAG